MLFRSVRLPSVRRSIAQSVTQSRPPLPLPLPQLSLPKPPSILQFISSRTWSATHRSGSASSRARNPFQPPRPRSFWQRFRDAVNAIPYKVVFWGVLVINGVVYASWNYAYAAYVRPYSFSSFVPREMTREFRSGAQVTPACICGCVTTSPQVSRTSARADGQFSLPWISCELFVIAHQVDDRHVLFLS